MPHVVVKMITGRSPELKQRLADQITKDLVAILRIGEESISVAIEDVAAGDWTERVFIPDIAGHPEQLYKQPGYDPLK